MEKFSEEVPSVEEIIQLLLLEESWSEFCRLQSDEKSRQLFAQRFPLTAQIYEEVIVARESIRVTVPLNKEDLEEALSQYKDMPKMLSGLRAELQQLFTERTTDILKRGPSTLTQL